MSKLTETHIQYIHLLKLYGYVVVTQGPTYATFVLNKRQMHSSSFEVLVKHDLLKRISEYKSPNGLIISIWEYVDPETTST